MPPKKATKGSTAPTRTSSRVKAKEDASTTKTEQEVTTTPKAVKPAAKSKAATKTGTKATKKAAAAASTTTTQTKTQPTAKTKANSSRDGSEVVELVSPPPPYTPVSASVTSSTTSDAKRKVTETAEPTTKKQKISATKSKTIPKPVDSSESESETELVKSSVKKEPARGRKNSKTTKATTKPAPVVKKSKLDAWFDDYADPEHPDELQMEQVMTWWDKGLHLNIESAAPYVLAYKLELPQMDSLKRTDFKKVMEENGVSSDAELRKVIEQEMKKLVPSTTSDNFAKFYKKFFTLAKQTPESKSLPLDQAQIFWSLILKPASFSIKMSEQSEENIAFPHVDRFVEFLGEQSQAKVINKDQWESFLRFNKDIGLDLTGYSEESSWPSLYDAYAAWLQSKLKTSVSTSNIEPES